MAPLDKQAEAERARRALAAAGAPGLAAGQQSDHLLLVAAYNLWQVCALELCTQSRVICCSSVRGRVREREKPMLQTCDAQVIFEK